MRLMVNGTAHEVDGIDPQTPLLWVLRDRLQLFGTRYGCGEGLCGACTVLLEGQPTRACLLPVSAAEGQSIRTIEGLSEDGQHPLQKAWRELQVPQCGFCQAGQILSAAALLERVPKPSEEEIETALGGNLCRCGTYQRIRAAVQLAAGAPEEAER